MTVGGERPGYEHGRKRLADTWTAALSPSEMRRTGGFSISPAGIEVNLRFAVPAFRKWNHPVWAALGDLLVGIIMAIYVMIRAFFLPRPILAAENLVLRQQVAIYQYTVKRPKLQNHKLGPTEK